MKRLFYSAGLLVLLLLGCQPDTVNNQVQPLSGGTIFPLDLLQKTTLDVPSNLNCMVNEDNMPGQGLHVNGSGLHVNGSAGGLIVGSVSDFALPVTIGSSLETTFFTNDSLANNTAVLVVDDFDGGVYELDKEVFYLKQLDDYLFGQLKADRKYSHGALVAYQVNQLIKGTGKYTLVQPFTGGTAIWEDQNSGHHLVVKAVDTGLADTTTIAAATVQALDEVSGGVGTGGISVNGPVAINMSFALIQCEILWDFEWAVTHRGINYFEDYMKALWLNNPQSKLDYDTFVKAVIDATNEPADPLLHLIQNPLDGAAKHVYVAASGNYGLDYGMYPANWPGVVSVSGSDARAPYRREESYFNQGEVLNIGSWFNLLGPGAKPTAVYYAGTSFTAPIISMFSAVDAASTMRCASGSGISNLSHDGSLNYDTPLEDYADPKGIPMAGAVTLLCP